MKVNHDWWWWNDAVGAAIPLPSANVGTEFGRVALHPVRPVVTGSLVPGVQDERPAFPWLMTQMT